LVGAGPGAEVEVSPLTVVLGESTTVVVVVSATVVVVVSTIVVVVVSSEGRVVGVDPPGIVVVVVRGVPGRGEPGRGGRSPSVVGPHMAASAGAVGPATTKRAAMRARTAPEAAPSLPGVMGEG
jgi:hypothetical protein